MPWDAVRRLSAVEQVPRSEVKKRLAQLELLAKKQKSTRDGFKHRAFYVQRVHRCTRDEILKQYGSIEGYLTQGLGLSADEITKLRERLLQ